MVTAFQADAVQTDAFQVDTATATVVVGPPSPPTGVWIRRPPRYYIPGVDVVEIITGRGNAVIPVLTASGHGSVSAASDIVAATVALAGASASGHGTVGARVESAAARVPAGTAVASGDGTVVAGITCASARVELVSAVAVSGFIDVDRRPLLLAQDDELLLYD